MSLRVNLNSRMDLLQHKMESNYHMEGEQAVYELQTLIDSVTFAWSVLSEEDQDYIHGCQFAIDSQSEWSA